MIETVLGNPDEPQKWGEADRRVKPALQTLLVDQAALINHEFQDSVDYDIRTGFPDFRRLIEWYQRAVVRTIGRIADRWHPIDCVSDRPLVEAMVGEDTVARKKYRLLAEASLLKPACNEAYKVLRTPANEYVKKAPGKDADEDIKPRDLDPYSQRHLAMRPGFQTLDNQQRAALKRLWGGFEDEETFADWVHALNAPSNGEIDDGLAAIVLTDETALDRLIYRSKTPEAFGYQATFAASLILPAFVDGVRNIDAHELAKRTSTGPETLDMRGAHHEQD